MSQGQTVFSQLLQILYREEVNRCLAKYPMPRSSRSFSGRDQFLSMAFAQMTFRESLRDIEECLRGNKQLHSMGINGNVTRTNLAYANEHRDWRVYEAVAQVLIKKARKLYAGDSQGPDIAEMVYALDSTTVDLCLEMFPWAHFRKTKAAVKLHTLMDIRGSIPVFISITEGGVHEVNILDEISYEPGSLYVMDRGYVDYGRLNSLHLAGAFFVTRAKTNMTYTINQSRTVDKSVGLRCDQTISLKNTQSKRAYPERLRRVSFFDPETRKRLVFITNHFFIEPITVAKIYKSRWHIEIFFKWIKQNLRIKSFYGTSVNAVKTQIWIAICVYLMVACTKKLLNLPQSLSRILQIISVNVFSKDPINELLTNIAPEEKQSSNPNQLIFNFL